MAEEAAAPTLPEQTTLPEQKKPARGRPKDDQAPPKPKNAFQRVTGVARKRIKEENPALATDLKGMADALKKAWEDTPEAEKERLTAEYETEMEIWRPKWAAYKETDHYKQFFEIKQDWMDIKTKKKMIKSHTKGKIEVGNVVRVAANFEMAYPEEEGTSGNYKLSVGQKGTIAAVNIGELPHCEIEWEGLGKKVFLKKYFGKLEDPDIPKRPKSGYMLFAGEVRERAQKEVMEAGGGMGDIGKKVSEWWEATSEVKKAEYGERSARIKEVYDKEFLVYKATTKFKQFENKKVNLESTQKLKKVNRVTMVDAPKRAPSSFSLWKKTAMPKLMEDNKAAGISMSMGELGKKMGELWGKVPQEEKDALAKQCAAAKKEWEKQHVNFKKNKKYMKFLEERQRIKIRQNRMVNLREMPKKPKSVFALYAKEHKAEVPQGKGEGKGTSALKQKFASALEEEKAKLAEQAKAAEEVWRKDLEDFKAGDQFKTFVTEESKVKREFMNEAMKVMTLKFINAAPETPAKTGFSIYLGEKRKADTAGEGEPKSKEAKIEEVKKYKADWDKISKGVKDEYETRRKEKFGEWKVEVEAFMKEETWQEYLKEARRLKVPIKSLLQDKKKQVKFLKTGMRFIPLPSKPETIPQRPPNAYKLFVKAKKQETSELEKIDEMWKALDDEGKKPFMEEANKLNDQYSLDMKEFRQSDDGKQFFREQRGALRTRTVVKAKFTYLKEMPKKPDGALRMYLEKNFKATKAANADLKGFEVRKKMTDQWLAMTPEEREPVEKEAKEKYDEYEAKMKAFKDSEEWKKYNKAVKVKKKAAPKVFKLREPAKPEGMPQKPPTALEAFGKQEDNAGLDASSLQAAFQKLDEETRDKLEAEAKEAEEKYNQELETFNGSEKGQAYRKDFANYERKKNAVEKKAKLAKATANMPTKPSDMPEKPAGAFKRFCKTQSGLDLAGLHRAYQALEEDKRKEFEAAAKEDDEKHKEALADFNSSEAGKKYQRAMDVYAKRKRLGEAKARFLTDMPDKPQSAFMIFLSERRDQVRRDNPDLKGLGAIMGKMSTMFKEMPTEEKEVYQKKEQEARDAYNEKMKEFESSSEYKKYKVVERAVSGKASSKASAKAKPSGPAPPVPPDDMPKKPPMAFFLFKMENRGSPKEVHEKWVNLGADGQKEWNDKSKQKMDEYEKAMSAFMKTAEGKKYTRLKAACDKKLAEKKARDRYLGGENVPKEPKRPMSSYFLFVNAKREGVVKELGSGKISEVSAKITEMWQNATKEDKEVFEKQAVEAKAGYEKAMAEYRTSDAVKKFDRAMNVLKKKPSKGKGKAKAKAGGRGAPKAKAAAKGGKAAADSDGSDSDVMGSDSSNSSSSDSDSD